MAIVINKNDLRLLYVSKLDNYPTSQWIHDPDLSGVDGYSQDHWKIDGDTVVPMTVEEISTVETQKAYDSTKEEITRLHQLAWEFIHQWYDEGGLLQLENWNNNCPEGSVVKDLIGAIDAWKHAVMFEYLFVKKEAVINQTPYDDDYSFIGDCPVSFTQVFLAVNSQYQPPGYTHPDVSSYAPGTR